jgi:hypothetical protein
MRNGDPKEVCGGKNESLTAFGMTPDDVGDVSELPGDRKAWTHGLAAPFWL